jgi:sugar/nucleoside kinase (ribokinase family)
VARRDFIAVGDVMLDVTVEEEALGRGGHVAGMVRVTAGGSAPTAAAWARGAVVSAAVVGRVGDDVAGRGIRVALGERGVEPLFTIDPDAPTGSVLTLGRTLVAERGANARFAPDDLPGELEAGAVLVSGYLLLHEDTERAGRAALERADAPWVAVDAASARLLDGYGRDRFFAATTSASVLLLNEEEAFVLTDEDAEGAARALAELYRLVCVKRGAAGAVAVLDGAVRSAKAPAAAGDRTGAGDAFAGALLAALATGRALDDALDAACRAGATAASASDPWPPRPA